MLYCFMGWKQGHAVFYILPCVIVGLLVIKALAYFFFVRYDFRNVLFGIGINAVLWSVLAVMFTIYWYVAGPPTLRGTAGMVVFDLLAAVNVILLAKLLRKKRETDKSTTVAQTQK